MEIQNVALQASGLAADCAGRRIGDLELNSQMRSTWDTGAFTSVELRGWDGRSGPVGYEVPETCAAELRFEEQRSQIRSFRKERRIGESSMVSARRSCAGTGLRSMRTRKEMIHEIRV